MGAVLTGRERRLQVLLHPSSLMEVGSAVGLKNAFFSCASFIHKVSKGWIHILSIIRTFVLIVFLTVLRGHCYSYFIISGIKI